MADEGICRYCGRPFTPNGRQRITCGSQECIKAHCRRLVRMCITAAHEARMQGIPCVICGKVFHQRRSNQCTCSKECAAERVRRKVLACKARISPEKRAEIYAANRERARAKRMADVAANPGTTFTCVICGKEFLSRRPDRKICGDPACATARARDLNRAWSKKRREREAANA